MSAVPAGLTAALAAHARRLTTCGRLSRGPGPLTRSARASDTPASATATRRNTREVRRDARQTLHPDLAVFVHAAPSGLPVPFALVMHDALFATHREWLGPRRAGAHPRARRARSRRARWSSQSPRLLGSTSCRCSISPPERVVVVPPAPARSSRPPRGRRAHRRTLRVRRYGVAIGDTGARGNLAHLAEAVGPPWRPRLPLVSAQRPPRADTTYPASGSSDRLATPTGRICSPAHGVRRSAVVL